MSKSTSRPIGAINLSELHRLQRENRELRSLLAVAYTGAALHCDDGELQDNRVVGLEIDFKRDDPQTIHQKMKTRLG